MQQNHKKKNVYALKTPTNGIESEKICNKTLLYGFQSSPHAAYSLREALKSISQALQYLSHVLQYIFHALQYLLQGLGYTL